ncbi:MAG: M16 family metallopeptidase [Candidatus Krumholzibacteriia bacterium]
MNLQPYRNEAPPHREILPGGAVLLSVPMPTAHAVTMGVFLRTGSQDESAALSGVSHFIEHMVFKGSERFSAFEIASGFDAIGASVDAFTTKDMVAFTIKVLPEYFAAGVDLLAEMLLRPTFAPDLVALEQNVVLEEIQEALDTPEDRLHDAFAERIYGAHGRSRPILGSEENVQGFDPGILRDQHARLFAPDNMIISLAGNLQAGFGELVAGHFGNGRSGGVAASAPAAGEAIAPAVPTGGESLRMELNSPIIQTYFELGNLAIPFHHPDRLGVYLLNNILGGGMSSRVFQAVREREGLAYTVYTYADMGRDIGLVSCAGSCSPDKVGRLEDIIRREYAALISSGVSAEELDGNRAQLKSQLIFSLEGIVNQMYRSARNEIYYGRFVPVAELVDEIDGVTEDDVVGCAGRYFDPDRLLVAVHGPASA